MSGVTSIDVTDTPLVSVLKGPVLKRGQKKPRMRTLTEMADYDATIYCMMEASMMEVTEERVHEDAAAHSSDGDGLKQEKLLRLPLGRVKNMVKMDPDISLASQESVFLIVKATELFVASLAKEVHRKASEAKRKILQKRDVELTTCIEEIEQLAFLEGTIGT